MARILIVGGTGPSGLALVERLLERGDVVTILHTGRHERTFSQPVERLHAGPRDPVALDECLADRSFDGTISTSGILTNVANAMAHRTDRFIAVTGLPAYIGWKQTLEDPGRPLPLRETDRPARALGGLPGDGLTARVQDNERKVFEAHADGAFRASVIRYTMVYGPYSYIPFEWFFVRRVLDGRQQLALESDGVMLPQRGFADNLAAAVLLLLDSDEADGRVFNGGDQHVLTVRAIARTVADALGHEFDMVSVPLAASPCRNPFALRQNTIFDLGSLRRLGYRDVVGVEQATRLTARWLAENPVERGSREERSIGDTAFDYDREDDVIARYRALL